MRRVGLIGGMIALAATAWPAESFLDRVDEALTGAWLQNKVHVRLSGALDLEGYRSTLPAPGLVLADGRDLFNPRLSLFFDAQYGAHVYAFVGARADHGFDPDTGRAQVRLDEYALRLTPWAGRRAGVQLGKFSTVVGNWMPRHGSWDNPFVTAPLPYENLTGIWDDAAVRTGRVLLAWAGVRPRPVRGGVLQDKRRSVPIVWGPSYASGAAIFGGVGKFDAAFEVKNAALSSRPEQWDVAQVQWQHPTYSGRIGYRPDARWNIGFSASTGCYLQAAAAATLPGGTRLDDFRETVLAHDIGFAWHRVQVWAEVYRARFAIPRVGPADTTAYYLETKVKFSPRWFGALRWNQQFFSTVRDLDGTQVRWGREVARFDAAVGHRFTPQVQAKLQCSWQHEDAEQHAGRRQISAQLTTRF